jgi:RHS repeat-associated protein
MFVGFAAFLAFAAILALSASPGRAGGPNTTNGNPCDPPGQESCGDPINMLGGNMYLEVTDYQTAGPNQLSFRRHYNSSASNSVISGFFPNGPWSTDFDANLYVYSTSEVDLNTGDGKYIPFFLSSGTWQPQPGDVGLTLAQSGSKWILTDRNDNTEMFTVDSSTQVGRLVSIRARNGYTRTLSYTNGKVTSVTDSYGRTLTFTYYVNNFGFETLLHTVSTPDGLLLTYSYNASSLLTGVSYSTSPQTSQHYLYENPTYWWALTGIIDENGNRFATWAYNDPTYGRATSTQNAGGANLFTVAYGSDGTTTATNALGVSQVYSYYFSQCIEIDRRATATTAAAKQLFTYDANGYPASRTDWNGNLTTYVNDARGLPTKTTEAAGTPQQRVTTIAWNPKFRLPDKIVAPGLTTTFTYDADGNLLTRTETDTTTHKTPYSTNGESRTWTFTWANFLPASLTDPRGNTMQFGWDAKGRLAAITNALGQVTRITAHTSGGLPETIIDPNGVETDLAYDVRQRLVTRTVHTAAGPLTTKFAYDAAGNLTMVTLPDGSALANTYDDAHRLVATADVFNEQIQYTLDALGDRTETDVLAKAGVKARTSSATFDALGRLLHDISGVGQTTTYTYDSNGNRVAITDPLGHATTQAFDPLNRLVKRTDAAGGVTGTAYDPQDHPVQITDPNGDATQYVYDGFGDVIETSSPDSGFTVYRYDTGGNLIERVDAAGAVTNWTYDALNRLTARKYPGDAADNVAYVYDEAGAGFGIGRLTHLTDAGGTLKFAYDERGNVLSETRTSGTTILVTKYAYNPASRLTAITYPSGAVVGYSLDAAGRIGAVSITAPGGKSPLPALSSIKYLPFGPPQAFAYGNGIGEMRGFDLDYRMTSLADKGNAFGRTLGYRYDLDDNVVSLSDTIAGGSQSFAYDALNRLTKAKGFYGTLSYAYDPLGNLLTAGSGAAVTKFQYVAGSNRLASLSQGGVTTRKFGYTATGNIDLDQKQPSDLSSAKNLVLGYSRANRLATVSGPLKTSPIYHYVYDAFGERLSKVRSGTPATGAQFRYDLAGNPIEEADFSGATQTLTDYVYLGNRPVARLSGGTLLFLHDDRLGTPQIVTGTNQGTDWEALYRPYGTIQPFVSAIPQNLRFPGQFADAESGYYHNGFRDYDPSLGRYLETDPIGLNGGLNTYLYAGANPVNDTDPLGLRNLTEDDCKVIAAMLKSEKQIGTWLTAWKFSNTGWVPSFSDPMGPQFKGRNAVMNATNSEIDLDWYATVIQFTPIGVSGGNNIPSSYDFTYVLGKTVWDLSGHLGEGKGSPYFPSPYSDPGERWALDALREGKIHFSDLFPPDFMRQNCPCLSQSG